MCGALPPTHSKGLCTFCVILPVCLHGLLFGLSSFCLFVGLFVGWLVGLLGLLLLLLFGWLVDVFFAGLFDCLFASFVFLRLAGRLGGSAAWLAGRQLAGRLACLTGGDDLYPISKGKYVRIMA